MKANQGAILLAMARAGMSQTDISRRGGVGLTSVKRALHGYNVAPRTVGGIAWALGVDPSEILTKKTRPPRLAPETSAKENQYGLSIG